MKKNVLANFIGKFWGLLSNFLFIPLYIHFLGFESYSIISFTLLIAGIMAILDAGLTATLSREFARADNDHNEKIRIFKTLEATYLIVIGLCILFVFFFSSVIAQNWMNLKSYTPQQASTFLKIISFDIGFQLLLRFYAGGLLGLEKQVKANFYQVGWGILRNGLVAIIIMIYPSLDIFFLWQAIATIIFALVIKVSLEKELKGAYSFRFSTKIEKAIFKHVWHFAGGMMLTAVVSALNTQMDKIAISKLLSLENLGYYTLAISLSQGIIVVVNPIATALLPRFTALYSTGKNEEASALFNQMNLIVSIVVFSIMANMCFFAKDLLWVWTGQIKLANQAAVFLPILAIPMSMIALTYLAYYVAIANGYTKLNNFLGIISLFATMPGYWVATRYYGAVGAASVFCIVQIITAFVYLFFINKKFLKSNVIKEIFIKQIILPIGISLGVAYLFSLVPNFSGNNRAITLIWIGISTTFTLLITVLIMVPKATIKNAVRFKKL
jgi:O-antigen/teichoic acid export membrane protein